MGEVYQNGQLLNIPNAYEDERFHADTDKKTGYTTHSILCSPILDTDDVTVAVVQVRRHGEEGPALSACVYGCVCACVRLRACVRVCVFARAPRRVWCVHLRVRAACVVCGGCVVCGRFPLYFTILTLLLFYTTLRYSLRFTTSYYRVLLPCC